MNAVESSGSSLRAIGRWAGLYTASGKAVESSFDRLKNGKEAFSASC
jgi:hypothetical protein